MSEKFDSAVERQERMKKLFPSPPGEDRIKLQKFIKSIGSIGRAAFEFAQNMGKVANRLNEIIKERELTLDDLSKFLSDLNYPPIVTGVFESIDIDLLKHLNNQLGELDNSKEQIKVLDEFIVNIFNDNYIDEKLEIWRDLECLKDRIHIIEEIVEAHKLKLYSLSTLAVFPQIEGVLAETFPILRNEKGNFTVAKQRKAFEILLDIKSDKSDSVWSAYYNKNTLRGFKHSKPIDYLSRHALVHGGDKNYGTIVNSTKSLMIFDYIITKVELYKFATVEETLS